MMLDFCCVNDCLPADAGLWAIFSIFCSTQAQAGTSIRLRLEADGEVGMGCVCTWVWVKGIANGWVVLGRYCHPASIGMSGFFFISQATCFLSDWSTGKGCDTDRFHL